MLGILAGAYSGITRTRNILYDRKVFPIKKVPIPVISIGNLTAGGTGKTPLAIRLSEWIRMQGLKPVILSRGYGGKKGCSPQVVPADGDVRDYGDEPVLMARMVSGIPVVISRDRVRGVLWSLDQFHVDCVILDDGFQHRRLGRDIDIVIVDARYPVTQERHLPHGRLREGVSALKRADLIVFSHADLSQPHHRDLDYIASLPQSPPVFLSRHRPVTIRRVWSDEMVTTEYTGTSVALISAIGSPEGFKASAEQMGLTIVYEKHFRDHKRLSPSEWQREIQIAGRTECAWVLITAKDETRFPKNLECDRPVCVLDIQIDMEEEKTFLAYVLRHAFRKSQRWD